MSGRVFGYGSLVNRRTHGYTDCRPAVLTGWRRVWRHSNLRSVAFLSVEKDAGTRIDGLLATVPPADWADLDHRERAYNRVNVEEATQHDGPAGPIILYEVAHGHLAPPDANHPILLSYFDVVVEGVLDHFGTEGLNRFVASTVGWDTGILDDRHAPVYPRYTAPPKTTLDQVDACLTTLGIARQAGTPDRLDPLRSDPQI